MSEHLPRFMFMQIIRGCNLRCTHCDFWKMKEVPEAFTIDTMRAMITEFAQVSAGKGTVVTCGGEPTMAIEKYWAMADEAHKHGLRMFSVMNGTRIRTIEDAHEFLERGADEITISLDGPDAEMHDRFRGVKGSFDKATRALRLLVRARHESKAYHKRLYGMTVLCNSLHGRLDEFFTLVLNDIGADKLKMNIIMPTFNGRQAHGHVDPYFDAEHIESVDKMIVEIQACDRKFGIHRNPLWLHQLEMYAKSVAGERAKKLRVWSTTKGLTKEHICNSYERNIMVSDLAHMQLCFSGDFPGMKWEKPGDLRRFWHGDDTAVTRGRMARCNRLCGISHSQRNSTSTLPAPIACG